MTRKFRKGSPVENWLCLVAAGVTIRFLPRSPQSCHLKRWIWLGWQGFGTHTRDCGFCDKMPETPSTQFVGIFFLNNVIILKPSVGKQGCLERNLANIDQPPMASRSSGLTIPPSLKCHTKLHVAEEETPDKRKVWKLQVRQEAALFSIWV